MSGWSNQDVNLIVLTEQTTGFSGLFGYSPTVDAGNLIFSLAAKAGTDPYGNAYPQGLSSTVGNISGTTFSGNDFIINNEGMYVYSGTPAYGNLIASITAYGGNDTFSNTVNGGISSYDGTATATSIFGGVIESGPAAQFAGTGGPSEIYGAYAGVLYLFSGTQNASDGQSAIYLQSTDAHGEGVTYIEMAAAEAHFDGVISLESVAAPANYYSGECYIFYQNGTLWAQGQSGNYVVLATT